MFEFGLVTGRALREDFEEAFALTFLSPEVHHCCLSVEPELLEVVEVLTEGVPDVRSRAFRSLCSPTLSAFCHERSAANIVSRMCRLSEGTVTKLDSTGSGGERANKYHEF